MWELKVSERWIQRLLPSGMWHRVVWQFIIKASKENVAPNSEQKNPDDAGKCFLQNIINKTPDYMT